MSYSERREHTSQPGRTDREKHRGVGRREGFFLIPETPVQEMSIEARIGSVILPTLAELQSFLEDAQVLLRVHNSEATKHNQTQENERLHTPTYSFDHLALGEKPLAIVRSAIRNNLAIIGEQIIQIGYDRGESVLLNILYKVIAYYEDRGKIEDKQELQDAYNALSQAEVKANNYLRRFTFAEISKEVAEAQILAPNIQKAITLLLSLRTKHWRNNKDFERVQEIVGSLLAHPTHPEFVQKPHLLKQVEDIVAQDGFVNIDLLARLQSYVESTTNQASSQENSDVRLVWETLTKAAELPFSLHDLVQALLDDFRNVLQTGSIPADMKPIILDASKNMYESSKRGVNMDEPEGLWTALKYIRHEAAHRSQQPDLLRMWVLVNYYLPAFENFMQFLRMEYYDNNQGAIKEIEAYLADIRARTIVARPLNRGK